MLSVLNCVVIMTSSVTEKGDTGCSIATPHPRNQPQPPHQGPFFWLLPSARPSWFIWGLLSVPPYFIFTGGGGEGPTSKHSSTKNCKHLAQQEEKKKELFCCDHTHPSSKAAPSLLNFYWNAFLLKLSSSFNWLLSISPQPWSPLSWKTGAVILEFSHQIDFPCHSSFLDLTSCIFPKWSIPFRLCRRQKLPQPLTVSHMVYTPPFRPAPPNPVSFPEMTPCSWHGLRVHVCPAGCREDFPEQMVTKFRFWIKASWLH